MQTRSFFCTAASIVAYRTTIGLQTTGNSFPESNTSSNSHLLRPWRRNTAYRSRRYSSAWGRDSPSASKEKMGKKTARSSSTSTITGPNNDADENAIQAREAVLYLWGNCRANCDASQDRKST